MTLREELKALEAPLRGIKASPYELNGLNAAKKPMPKTPDPCRASLHEKRQYFRDELARMEAVVAERRAAQ